MNLVERCHLAGLRLAIAESLTGGQVCAAIVDFPGASRVFLGGVISYQDAIKVQMLGVNQSLIQQQGAVDPEVVAQMAHGVRQRLSQKASESFEKTIGLATTGVAGPESIGLRLPGTVYIGLSSELGEKVFAFHFDGDRSEVRARATEAAIAALGDEIQLVSGL
ncbi:CinA family protein [Aquiluna borgnonia]|uniref:CinA family protein n=1 Tax=Aquiluna borgnonia TaxID=2499157 RepID=A0A7D4TJ85_9MICO|nr:CinA family protein [Aquiluna borgnonia]QKJ25451.1 CinA family protein [Aquiluna borgnonia]